MTALRNCAICGNPVTHRKYQDDSARVCSPGCAKTLAVREHPDIEPSTRKRLAPGAPGYWRDRLDTDTNGTGTGGTP